MIKKIKLDAMILLDIKVMIALICQINVINLCQKLMILIIRIYNIKTRFMKNLSKVNILIKMKKINKQIKIKKFFRSFLIRAVFVYK